VRADERFLLAAGLLGLDFGWADGSEWDLLEREAYAAGAYKVGYLPLRIHIDNEERIGVAVDADALADAGHADRKRIGRGQNAIYDFLDAGGAFGVGGATTKRRALLWGRKLENAEGRGTVYEGTNRHFFRGPETN